MLRFYCSSTLLQRSWICRSISSVLAAVSLLSGVVPEVSPSYPHLIFRPAAYTQDFTNAEILNYARAVLQIESQRQQAYRRIREIIGQTPPNLACHQPHSLSKLPREAQKVAVDFCNNSKKIAENSGLSAAQFNRITQRAQTDRALKRRIQNAMIQIQRQRK